MPMKTKKIFIIEDDESVQKILKLMFEKAGYEIEISPDGESIFKEHPHLPDLFLLDKHLIRNDGLEICRYLKSKDTTRNIPVIMLSATPGIESLARNAGADDFMEKPFNSAALMTKVQEFLK
jgi:DNA-binding response OmpR family regulator